MHSIELLEAVDDRSPNVLLLFLWAVPRSVSTAFERTFVDRRDTKVVHEPFTRSYYFSKRRRSERYGSFPNLENFDALRGLREAIKGASKLVFVKELAFQGAPYITSDLIEAGSHSFLIRHPKRVLRSLLLLKPDATEEEYGFAAIYDLWKRIKEENSKKKFVMDGESFRATPEWELQRFCRHFDIQFQPEHLSWRSGKVRPWEADETDSQAKWHSTLEKSSGILPPEPEPEFEVPPGWVLAYDRACAIYDELRSHIR